MPPGGNKFEDQGPYQDIQTKWIKFQDNCWFQDNFRTSVTFQKFQDNWKPCYWFIFSYIET